MRTTKAISGCRLKQVSGDGRLVFQGDTAFPVPRLRLQGDNGELLMATGMSGSFTGPVIGVAGGLKELVGGKIQDYALPGIAGSA